MTLCFYSLYYFINILPIGLYALQKALQGRYRMKSVFSGSNLTLPCILPGLSDETNQAVYIWHRQLVPVKGGHFVVDGKGNLHIYNVSARDNDIYLCVAKVKGQSRPEIFKTILEVLEFPSLVMQTQFLVSNKERCRVRNRLKYQENVKIVAMEDCNSNNRCEIDGLYISCHSDNLKPGNSLYIFKMPIIVSSSPTNQCDEDCTYNKMRDLGREVVEKIRENIEKTFREVKVKRIRVSRALNDLRCQPGYELSASECRPCKPGHFSTHGICTKCPHDSFMPKYAAKGCYACPKGRSNFLRRGSRTLDECHVIGTGMYIMLASILFLPLVLVLFLWFVAYNVIVTKVGPATTAGRMVRCCCCCICCPPSTGNHPSFKEDTDSISSDQIHSFPNRPKNSSVQNKEQTNFSKRRCRETSVAKQTRKSSGNSPVDSTSHEVSVTEYTESHETDDTFHNYKHHKCQNKSSSSSEPINISATSLVHPYLYLTQPPTSTGMSKSFANSSAQTSPTENVSVDNKLCSTSMKTVVSKKSSTFTIPPKKHELVQAPPAEASGYTLKYNPSFINKQVFGIIDASQLPVRSATPYTEDYHSFFDVTESSN